MFRSKRSLAHVEHGERVRVVAMATPGSLVAPMSRRRCVAWVISATPVKLSLKDFFSLGAATKGARDVQDFFVEDAGARALVRCPEQCELQLRLEKVTLDRRNPVPYQTQKQLSEMGFTEWRGAAVYEGIVCGGDSVDVEAEVVKRDLGSSGEGYRDAARVAPTEIELHATKISNLFL